jgi:hypothetical protein
MFFSNFSSIFFVCLAFCIFLEDVFVEIGEELQSIL